MAAEPKAKEGIMGWRYAWGIILGVLGPILALSMFSYSPSDISWNCAPPNDPAINLIGPVGGWTSLILFWWLGVAAYAVPVAALIFSAVLFLDRAEKIWPRFAWFALVMAAVTNLLELNGQFTLPTCRKLNIVDPGGVFSCELTQHILIPLFSRVGTGIILGALLAAAVVFTIGVSNLLTFGRWIRRGINLAIVTYNVHREERLGREETLEREERRVKRRMRLLEKETEQDEKPIPKLAPRTRTPEPVQTPVTVGKDDDKEDDMPLLPIDVKTAPKPVVRPKPEPPPKELPKETPKPAPVPVKVAAPEPKSLNPPSDVPRVVGGRPYLLPPLSLLSEIPAVKAGEPAVDVAATGRVLVDTLAEFGIEVEMVDSQRGPVVTRYELLPAPGVRVERISALSNNISLALKSHGVRVQAPVPGKGVVGIEVPNASSVVVCMREIMEGDAWRNDKIHLPLAIGKDVAGNDLVIDLAAMPHLLIAGSTGSGKTVCMNSILVGLLMARTPEELRLLLVDPKIVEFSTYNNLPHLVVPVVTNPKKVALALRWAITEMEKRYKLFARVGVRNIEGYNTRPIVKQVSLFAPGEVDAEKEEPSSVPDKVPYIVIVIDELADLMLADQAEIENCIARLAQLSRAVGIHMILATQRPSVNVITGTIKANFPARIAFQVAQKVDSRTILDTIGADKLLGRGDMLYLQPSTGKVIRAQGTLTKDDEINRIVEYIKKQGEPVFENEIHDKLERTSSTPMDDGGEDDEIIEKAIQIIRETQRASTSSLQRRLGIGYTRAARIIDILEERGVIGPPRGANAREILIDLDGEVPQNPPDEPDGEKE